MDLKEPPLSSETGHTLPRIPSALQDETFLSAIASFKSKSFPWERVAVSPTMLPGNKYSVCTEFVPAERRSHWIIPCWRVTDSNSEQGFKRAWLWQQWCWASMSQNTLSGAFDKHVIMLSMTLCYVTCEFLFTFENRKSHTVRSSDNQHWSLGRICTPNFSPAP